MKKLERLYDINTIKNLENGAGFGDRADDFLRSRSVKNEGIIHFPFYFRVGRNNLDLIVE
jgi:hypothetical protein